MGPRYVYTLDLKATKGYVRLIPGEAPEKRQA